ncbi:MAG: hypothetical protein A2901_08930 [Elusimicrobia bacterium RIFCSPLOWO2_01_FULL_54_10]|nr:MAG: hypothetical protein A2901_08930 [Elusimicrobia bacterium RIFCSPLOWO2_01_FULL_54_10]
MSDFAACDPHHGEGQVQPDEFYALGFLPGTAIKDQISGTASCIQHNSAVAVLKKRVNQPLSPDFVQPEGRYRVKTVISLRQTVKKLLDFFGFRP